MAREIDALIRKLESVGELTPAEREAIESLSVQPFSLRKGQDLLADGETPNRVTLLLDGFAHRYKSLADGRRQIFAFHTPGDVPDLHTLQQLPADHSIAATGDCLACHISHSAVFEAFSRAPQLINTLWRSTLIDASIFRIWMLNMGRRDAAVQMAHLFCELYARLRAVGRADDFTFRVPVIQEELADAMGISTVHANRVLQQLRRRRLVTFDTQLVHIPDWPLFCAFAEFDPDYLHLREPV